MSRLPDSPSDEARERLTSRAAEVVDEVTAALYRRHPEWESRYGVQGRDSCREDLSYHIEYMRACLETGYVEPFREYARWLASVLEGRGMAPTHLAESFSMLSDAWSRRLAPADHALVDVVFRAGVAALEESDPYEPAFYRHLTEAAPVATTLTRALLEGDRGAARQIIFDPLNQGMPLVDVGIGVIQPAMYEIGRLWQASRVSIAQEHLATAISESLLAQAFAAAEFAPPARRKALFACVQGNHHALGLRMVSDGFEVEGWEVQFLGADTPTTSLIEQVDRFRPDLVGLSISLPSQIPAGRRVIEQLRGEGGAHRPAILVGGLALNQLEGLWRDVGADLWSPNAKAAIREAR